MDIGVAAELLTNPGFSVFKDAQIAVSGGAIHDPTEGGLATAL